MVRDNCVVEADVDHEPDYRFTLANERTFLAWVRTALGLLAGGIAVSQFYTSTLLWHKAIGAVCIVLAGLIAVGAFWQWRRVQLAMRRDQPLPRPPLVPVTVVGAGIAALLALALVAP
ncbi:YidH family protein [Nocardia tengchongensis]|uniref:YidH family protein n=1 Tax=Nocardia tengchongensis TaxID=2055889 RepID=UPI00369D0022